MFNKLGEGFRFKVQDESVRLNSRMTVSLPSIEMAYDNDA